MRTRLRTLAAVAAPGVIFAVVSAGTSVAQADPSPGATPREFVAIGSASMQSWFDGLAYGYVNGEGVPVAPVAPNLDNIDGGEGCIPALEELETPGDPFGPGGTPSDSADIVRCESQPPSDSLVAAGDPDDDLTWIQVAREATTVVVGAALRGVVANVTTTQLVDLYSGTNDPGNGVVVSDTGDPTLNGTTVHVELPQPDSGARQSFLTALFGTQSPTLASYVDTTSKLPGNTGASNTLEENDAGEIESDGLIPFSAAQYITQFNGITEDTGVASLGLPTVDGRTAVDIDSSTGVASVDTSSNSLYGDSTMPIGAPSTTPPNPAILSSDVYAVVLTAELASDPDLQLLVEDVISGDAEAIEDFGLLPLNFPTPSADYLHTTFIN